MGVRAFFEQQFRVIAYFNNAAIFHHHNPIGLLNRGQTVRNHERGAVVH